MRSMPSVYSAMRGSGITTSSLILKALVCLLMAAVRLRSSQNFLRASGLMATKPSPLRELAMRTTSEVARATASASSPAMSPTSTILGSAGRAWTWWSSPPPSGSGRPGAPGRPAATPERFCSANMKSLISTMLGTASLALPKNSRHTVRVCCRHAVHHPAAAGDQAVAAFLLDAGQAGEELVRHVLAQAFLAEGARRGSPAARCAPASCRRPAK